MSTFLQFFSALFLHVFCKKGAKKPPRRAANIETGLWPGKETRQLWPDPEWIVTEVAGIRQHKARVYLGVSRTHYFSYRLFS